MQGNPITELLAQASMHAQNEQRSLSNDTSTMNSQELMLMQMLKTNTDTTTSQMEINENNNNKNNTAEKIRYEPQFLLTLEHSPLVLPISYWSSELPPIEFFRLNLHNNNNNNNNRGSKQGNENRRERRRSSNTRRGSNLKKDKRDSFLDDLKLENSAREDRKIQRARQRENKRRGKMDTSAIEEEENDNDSAAPQWMKDEDNVPPSGNSMLDFELWRLKMRIETAKRNGEDVSPDDMAEYSKLKAKIENSKAPLPTTTITNDVNDNNNNNNKQLKEEVTKESVNEQLLEKVEPNPTEKNQLSVDDEFSLPLSTKSHSYNTTGSHFSSFFTSSDKQVESPPPLDKSNRSSRLMSILSDENQNPVSPPNVNVQQQNTPPQPQINTLPLNNDKNQMFLQSLLSKSTGIPPIQQQKSPLNQSIPNGMDPRMMPGLPSNMQFFPPNMQQMPMQLQTPQQTPQQQQQRPNQNQRSNQTPSQPPQPPQHQQSSQQSPQNLPYGNNNNNTNGSNSSIQGMTPNHPLMMLLNKNKKKGSVSQDKTSSPSTPTATSTSIASSTPTPPSNSQTPLRQNIPMQLPPQPNGQMYPPFMNNNGIPGNFGMPLPPNINGMNGVNGMNGMNGFNGMNPMNSMNPMNMNMMNMNMMNMNMMNGMNMNGSNVQQSQPPPPQQQQQQRPF